MSTNHYDVSLQLETGGLKAEATEDLLVRLVDLLIAKARGLALGATGAIHGETVELVFTVEASDSAEMYTKLRDIALILRDADDIELTSTSARRGDRELALA